jgi:hypothetical protein
LYPTLCGHIIEIKTSRPSLSLSLVLFLFSLWLANFGHIIGRELLELELGNVNKKFPKKKKKLKKLHQILLDLNMQQNKNSQVPKL